MNDQIRVMVARGSTLWSNGQRAALWAIRLDRTVPNSLLGQMKAGDL
jgi:hypothetical protein